MDNIIGNSLKVLLVGVIVGLVGSVIGGWLFATPTLIARKLPLAFLVAGAAPGSSNGTSLAWRTYFATVCAIGTILGWVIYRGIVL